jgi:hypothetical protein
MPVFIATSSTQARLAGSFRELVTGIISIKTNKEQGQKKGGTVLYCTSSSNKERSLSQTYIARDK